MKIRVFEDRDFEILISVIKDGFMINSFYQDEDWLKKRVSNNKNVYLLEDEEIGCIGFLVGYSKKLLEKMKLSDNKVVKHILKHYPGDFFYLDFLVIKNSEKNKGMEKILISSIMDDAKKKMVYSAIKLGSEIDNKHFLKELDFFDFGFVEKIPNEENPEFEIYEKEA